MSRANASASSGSWNVRIAGGRAILTFQEPDEALAFALDLRQRFHENGLEARVGIDEGPVLVFRNENGPSGISGDAVNIASKLCEDIGEPGRIRLTERVAEQLARA